MHQYLDLYQYLRDFGILPGSNTDISTIKQAVKVGLNGREVVFNCKEYSDIDYPVLTQIQICLTKTLNVMDCPKRLGTCPKKGLVYYPKEFKNFRAVEKLGNFSVLKIHNSISYS